MPPEGSNRQSDTFPVLRRRGLAWVVVLSAILITSLIRVHLLEVPLERDEGEYAYMAQLLLKGIPPYEAAYSMKFPGIYAAYALVLLVFGQTQTGVHLGLLVVNAATAALVFLIARRLLGQWSGAAAGACFSVLSLSATVQGMMANAEHFVILFAAGGFLLLLRWLEGERKGRASLFASGLLLGSSVLMKQHGAAFVLFGLLYLSGVLLMKRDTTLRPVFSSMAVFSSGVVLPFAATMVLLLSSGVFDRFWFWTIEYPRAYTSLLGYSEAAYVFKFRAVRILASMLPAVAVASFGLCSVVWDGNMRKRVLFLSGLTIFSFISMVPGLHFWPHYFVLVLPAISLLFGAGMTAVHRLISGPWKASGGGACLVLALFALAFPVYRERDVLLFDTPLMVSRKVYGYNPFPEAVEVARYIRENSEEDDRVAVIGSEPEIYFYSGRLSATGYIYAYPMVENHRYARQMTEEMTREVESARPLFLVFVNFRTSWLTTEGYSERKDYIFDWFGRYARDYELVGLAEAVAPFETNYYWDEMVPRREPRYKYWIAVYKRRPSGQELY